MSNIVITHSLHTFLIFLYNVPKLIMSKIKPFCFATIHHKEVSYLAVFEIEISQLGVMKCTNTFNDLSESGEDEQT